MNASELVISCGSYWTMNVRTMLEKVFRKLIKLRRANKNMIFKMALCQHTEKRLHRFWVEFIYVLRTTFIKQLRFYDVIKWHNNTWDMNRFSASCLQDLFLCIRAISPLHTGHCHWLLVCCYFDINTWDTFLQNLLKILKPSQA